ncbi:MOSC domain protein [Rhodobacteraceae bacterium HTCC2150]|nr:MOSC domain protein [Rhodobacteraceae bacterium HTCC2150]
MTITVAHIWRHPIKSHGRETLTEVSMNAGQTMPWDRTWAVAHEAAKTDGSEWAVCANFSRGAKSPQLMAIDAALDEATETVTLMHPDKEPLIFRPDQDVQPFLEWSSDLTPSDRAQSSRIVRVANRGMTDTPFPSVSLMNLATNQVVEERLGQKLDIRRWRGNFWLDGMKPWEEFDWIGKKITIGTAELMVREPVTRCLATTANPETGQRDADTLSALQDGFGHKDFGIYAEVTKSGVIRANDTVTVLS